MRVAWADSSAGGGEIALEPVQVEIVLDRLNDQGDVYIGPDHLSGRLLGGGAAIQRGLAGQEMMDHRHFAVERCDGDPVTHVGEVGTFFEGIPELARNLGLAHPVRRPYEVFFQVCLDHAGGLQMVPPPRLHGLFEEGLEAQRLQCFCHDARSRK